MNPIDPKGREVGEDEPARFLPLLETVSQTVAFPHGYTLLVWGTSMITVSRHGLPSVAGIFCFLTGAWLAYVMSGSYAKHETGRLQPGQHRLVTQPFVVASGNIVTLCLATAASALAGLIPVSILAWLAVGFVGTGAYMIGITVQALLISHWLDRPKAP